MRKKAIVVCVFLFFGFLGFSQGLDVDTWVLVYKNSTDMVQKHEVMKQIIALNDTGFIDFYVDALDDLVKSQLSLGTNREAHAKNQLSILIMQELARLEVKDAAHIIFDAYIDAPEVVLKSEAALALGNIGAVNAVERLVVDLQTINEGPVPENAKGQEMLAVALVTSLANIKDPRAYEALFVATLSWYSKNSMIKDKASAALPTLSDNPTDSLSSIIKTNPDVTIKQEALQAALDSSASTEKKLDVLRIALRIGLDRKTIDVIDQRITSNLRVTALKNLTELKDSAVETVPMLEEIVLNDSRTETNDDEIFAALVALGSNGTDEAVRVLSNRLITFNAMERQKGNTVRDKRMIRQIIESLRIAKNPLARAALNDAKNSDYDANIKNLIEVALKEVN